MTQTIRRWTSARAFAFSLGFVLGAATMASPALGLSLAVLCGIYILYTVFS